MIETVINSIILPAIVFGILMVLGFWTSLARWPRLVWSLLTVGAAACFAAGHIVLQGWPDGTWLQAVPFLIPLALIASVCALVSHDSRLLQSVFSVALISGAVTVFSGVLRADGPDWDNLSALAGVLATLPLLAHIWLTRQSHQSVRLGWIISLTTLSGALTLTGSALLGQVAGIIVAGISTYFVFSLISAIARTQQPAHFVWLLLGVCVLLLGHFLVDTPKLSLLLIGSALTLSSALGLCKNTGAMSYLLGAVILGLNGTALYLAYLSTL